MLTRLNFTLPEFKGKRDSVEDLHRHVAELRRGTLEIFRRLNDKDALFEPASYTPTVTSGSGTLTSVTSISGSYTKVGRIYIVHKVKFTVTTNGTGATSLKFTLPATATDVGVFYGLITTTGRALIGNVASGSNTVAMVQYDASYPGADGRTFEIAGFFI